MSNVRTEEREDCTKKHVGKRRLREEPTSSQTSVPLTLHPSPEPHLDVPPTPNLLGDHVVHFGVPPYDGSKNRDL